MPTARNGECLSQASIDLWLGARHWSKPKPRKLPGVATLPVAADPAPVAVVTLAITARAVAASRGRSSIGSPGWTVTPWCATATENDNHNSHTRHSESGQLLRCSSPETWVVRP